MVWGRSTRKKGGPGLIYGVLWGVMNGRQHETNTWKGNKKGGNRSMVIIQNESKGEKRGEREKSFVCA